MVAEIENNDVVPQELNLGFGAGQVTSLTVNGSISTIGSVGSFINVAVFEENGSIPTAVQTGLTAGESGFISELITLSSSSPNNSFGEDTEFFQISANAGQRIFIDANGRSGLTIAGFEEFDPAISLYNSDGVLIAFNDDQSAFSTDSELTFIAPEDGDYFVAIHHFATFILDPFEADENFQIFGLDSAGGDVDLDIDVRTPDIDQYNVTLNAGDVVEFAVDNLDGRVLVHDQNGTLISSTSDNLSDLVSDFSSLQNNTSADIASGFVATSSGTYTVSLAGQATGSYNLDFNITRPTLEQNAVNNVQYIYLDFETVTLDTTIFGGTDSSATLSGFESFLDDFNIAPSDLDATINAIIANVQNILVDDIAANGTNSNFNIEILNSRDNPGINANNLSNVTTVHIAGSISEFGISTIGIAESIDIGNLDTSDSAVVLLDLLSAPSTNPNSVNSLTLAPGTTIIDAVGLTVGSIAAHEAAHLLGTFHTDPTNPDQQIIDAGGVFLIPTGNDGIFGSADDPDFLFGVDILDAFEDNFGTQDSLNLISNVVGGGLATAGFFFNLETNTLSYTGDDGDDNVTIQNRTDTTSGQARVEGLVAGNSIPYLTPKTLGAITIDLGEGDNTLAVFNNAQLDTIFSGDGSDNLRGNNSANVFQAGLGFDTLDGGGGVDTVDYGDSAESVFVDLFGNPNFGGTAFGDTLISIENVSGSGFGDIIGGNQDANVLSGGNGADTLTGFGGDDTLNGGAGADILQGVSGLNTLNGGDDGDTIFGGTDMDTINGDDGGDVLFGAGGNDTINGGLGDDGINGGAGDDIIQGGLGSDIIFGEGGVDTLNGGDNNDTIFGGADGDIINGDAGDDLLVGEGGNDFIQGGAGLDFLSGGAGVDILNGDADTDLLSGGDDGDILNGGGANDVLFGDAGSDTLNGDDGVDVLFGDDNLLAASGAGNDVLNGGNDGDLLFGGFGIDTLNGDAGDDVIFGGADGDFINGGAGTDFVLGDAGNDIFIFTAGNDADVVLDFEDDLDALDLSSFGFANVAAALDVAIEDSGNVFFNFGNGDSLNVFNVTEAQLTDDIIV